MIVFALLAVLLVRGSEAQNFQSAYGPRPVYNYAPPVYNSFRPMPQAMHAPYARRVSRDWVPGHVPGSGAGAFAGFATGPPTPVPDSPSADAAAEAGGDQNVPPKDNEGFHVSAEDPQGTVDVHVEEEEVYHAHKFDVSHTDTLKAVNASNLFGSRFYSVLSKIYPNFVFSPVTISFLMALILRGADGNTLKEIYDSMGYRESGLSNLREVQNGFHGLAHEYLTENNNQTTGFKSNILTSMWINDGKKINTMYLEDAANYFHTKLRGINFRLGSDRTQSIINKWVKDRTQGRVLSCSVRKVPFSEETEIVFLNTIHFSAYWASEFQFALETTGTFYSLAELPIKAKFLQATTALPYAESSRLKASMLEIPFRAGIRKRHSLVVLLPNADSSIQELEVAMGTFSDISAEMGTMTRTLLNVMIPKNVAQDSLRLDRLLQIMGIKSVFQADQAELTYISAYERLAIDKIFHEAVFEFKEVGTSSDKAGAGAGLDRAQQEANLNQDMEGDIKEFYANRPFVFLILEKTLNTVLFMGRVVSV